MAYHNLWLCHIKQLEDKKLQTSSINSHQTTEISPRSWDSQPYLRFQLNEVITFVQHKQLSWVQKGWGIQKTCVYHLRLLSCPLPSPHHTHKPPTHFILSPSFSFSMVAGERTVIIATHHANSRVSHSFQARHADSLYFCCTFRKPLNSTRDTGITNMTKINASLGC